MLSVPPSWLNNCVFVWSYFFFSNFVDKCFRLGNWYIGSNMLSNVLKRSLSTTDKGIRSTATNSTSASVTKICFGLLESYFFLCYIRWVSVCCASSSDCSFFKTRGWTLLYNYFINKHAVWNSCIIFLPSTSTNLL